MEENEKLKYDIKIFKKIIEMAVVTYLPINRFIKIIINRKTFTELYYYPKLNLFISKVDLDLFFLPEYSYPIFSKNLGNKLFEGAKEILFFREFDIKELHKFAVEFCENNAINYMDDFTIEERRIGKNDDFKNLEKKGGTYN